MKSIFARCLVAVALIAAVGMSVPAVSAEKKASDKPATKQTKKANPKKTDPKKVEKPLPKLLDLGSDKCVPCKMMFPVLDQLKKDYKGKLKVEFIDVWKDRKAGETYKISSIPTQIFYDAKGKELFRHVGYISEADIVAKFKDLGIKLTK